MAGVVTVFNYAKTVAIANYGNYVRDFEKVCDDSDGWSRIYAL